MTIPTIDIGTLIPSDNARRAVYAVFGLLGLALSATQIGFGAAEIAQPVWLTVALAVYGFIAASGFGVALANVRPAAVVAYED